MQRSFSAKTAPIDPATARFAGFWIRVGAYAIDMLILLIVFVPSMFVKDAFLYLVLLIPLVLYKPLLEGTLGATAGKLALGLRVVDEQGQPIGIVTGFVRAGIFILPILPQAILHVKMLEEGISVLDFERAAEFQQQHAVLSHANLALNILVFASCVMIGLNMKKRGLHDHLAATYVVYSKPAQ